MPKIHTEIKYVHKMCKIQDGGSLFPRTHPRKLKPQNGENTFLRNVLNLTKLQDVKKIKDHTLRFS